MFFIFYTLKICVFALLAFTEIAHFRAFFTIEITFLLKIRAFSKVSKTLMAQGFKALFLVGFDSGVATSTIRTVYPFGYAVFIIVCLWAKTHLLPWQNWVCLASEVNGSLLTIDAGRVTGNLFDAYPHFGSWFCPIIGQGGIEIELAMKFWHKKTRADFSALALKIFLFLYQTKFIIYISTLYN